jgi:hypothetical protein
MKFSSRIVQVVTGNIVVWLIYLASNERGFPWPIFVTIGSIPVFFTFTRFANRPARDRQRNRQRRK